MPPSAVPWPLGCIIAGAAFFGLVVAGLAIPVALSTQDIADDIKKQQPAQKGIKGGANLLRPAVFKGGDPQQKDGPIVQMRQMVVIALCCCCCCLALNAEPINEAIVNVTQIALYSISAMMFAYGGSIIAIAWGLFRMRSWARLSVVFLVGWVNLGLCLMLMVASIPVGFQMDPEYAVGIGLPGGAAAGFWFYSLYFLTQDDTRALFRRRAKMATESEYSSETP